jgi:hypothetical protein
MASKFVGSTVTRLSLATPWSPVGGFTDVLIEGANREAFVDFLSPTAKGSRSGLARIDAPLACPPDFDDGSLWVLHPTVVLAWREDTKKVPPKRLKAALDEATKAWCKANLRDRCPAMVKTEIKESIELALLPRCMPASKVVNIVWNFVEGWVLLSTRSASAVEGIRKRLHRAFGVVLSEEAPDDGLSAATLEALGATSPLVLGGLAPRHEPPLPA